MWLQRYQLFFGIEFDGTTTVDRRPPGRSKCCGESCDTDADNSHYCIICNTNVCGICVLANYDGSEPEPMKVNVICDKHVTYCTPHKLSMRQLQIPTAGGTTENRTAGWEESYDVSSELKNDTAKRNQAIELVKSATWNE